MINFKGTKIYSDNGTVKFKGKTIKEVIFKKNLVYAREEMSISGVSISFANSSARQDSNQSNEFLYYGMDAYAWWWLGDVTVRITGRKTTHIPFYIRVRVTFGLYLKGYTGNNDSSGSTSKTQDFLIRVSSRNSGDGYEAQLTISFHTISGDADLYKHESYRSVGDPYDKAYTEYSVQASVVEVYRADTSVPEFSNAIRTSVESGAPDTSVLNVVPKQNVWTKRTGDGENTGVYTPSYSGVNTEYYSLSTIYLAEDPWADGFSLSFGSASNWTTKTSGSYKYSYKSYQLVVTAGVHRLRKADMSYSNNSSSYFDVSVNSNPDTVVAYRGDALSRTYTVKAKTSNSSSSRYLDMRVWVRDRLYEVDKDVGGTSVYRNLTTYTSEYVGGGSGGGGSEE